MTLSSRPIRVISINLRGAVAVGGKIQRPAGVTAHVFTRAFPAVAVTIKVAVLELDSGAIRRLGDEPHLDLARLVEVGLDLPVRADVPTEHDPVRRLVGNHASPLALAP